MGHLDTELFTDGGGEEASACRDSAVIGSSTTCS